MSKKRTNKSSKKQIVEYWWSQLSIRPDLNEIYLNFDWSDALDVCWNCGRYTKSTDRCHIEPHMCGGEDIPSNYVLLCGNCHDDAPDIVDKNSMWDWIKSNKMKYYGSYNLSKALEQLDAKYGSIFNELSNVNNANNLIIDNLNKIGYHNGMIKQSTFVALFEKVLKENTVEQI